MAKEMQDAPCGETELVEASGVTPSKSILLQSQKPLCAHPTALQQTQGPCHLTMSGAIQSSKTKFKLWETPPFL